MTNPAHIAETAVLLLAAYLLGCVLGYAARRILHAGRGTRQVAAAPLPEPYRPRSTAARLAAIVDDEPPARPPIPSARPVTLSAPRGGRADNLKQIKGIGPKIEASLYSMGIFHIDQIAGWSKADMAWVEAQLTFKGRIRCENWVEQAADLCKLKASA
mgnify:CR=1 FL=1